MLFPVSAKNSFAQPCAQPGVEPPHLRQGRELVTKHPDAVILGFNEADVESSLIPDVLQGDRDDGEYANLYAGGTQGARLLFEKNVALSVVAVWIADRRQQYVHYAGFLDLRSSGKFTRK